eukprot:gene9427-14615_t
MSFELCNNLYPSPPCPATRDNYTLISWMATEPYPGSCAYSPAQAAGVVMGMASICFWICVTAPQLYVNYKLKKAEGLSPFFLLQWFAGDITNLIGCYLTHQNASQTWLAIYYVTQDVALLSQYTYYKKYNERLAREALLEAADPGGYESDSEDEDDGPGEHAGLLNSYRNVCDDASPYSASGDAPTRYGSYSEYQKQRIALRGPQGPPQPPAAARSSPGTPATSGVSPSSSPRAVCALPSPGEAPRASLDAKGDQLTAYATARMSLGDVRRALENPAETRGGSNSPVSPVDPVLNSSKGGAFASLLKRKSSSKQVKQAKADRSPPSSYGAHGLLSDNVADQPPHTFSQSGSYIVARTTSGTLPPAPPAVSESDVVSALSATGRKSTSRSRRAPPGDCEDSLVVSTASDFRTPMTPGDSPSFPPAGPVPGIPPASSRQGATLKAVSLLFGSALIFHAMGASQPLGLGYPQQGAAAAPRVDGLSRRLLQLSVGAGLAPADDGSSGSGSGNEETYYIGIAIGWVSACLYLGSRVPQLVKNCRRGSTDGLSPLMFSMAVMGNVTYFLGIILMNETSDSALCHLPWIIGSLGTVQFDMMALVQFIYYNRKAQTKSKEKRDKIKQLLEDGDNEDDVINSVPM